MGERAFKVGDEVAVVRVHYPPRIATVVREMVRFVELSDGSRWKHNGLRYPREQSSYLHDRLVHATDEHRERARRAEAQHVLEAVVRDHFHIARVPTATLVQIAELLRSAEASDG